MKLYLTLVLMLAHMAISCEKAELPDWDGESDASVMSFNLRFDTEEDGENRWDNKTRPALICWQKLILMYLVSRRDYITRYHS